MKISKAKLKDLSLADIKVLSDDSEKQWPNFSPESPEYNYHINLINALALEKKDRLEALIEKDDSEKTEGEKAEEAAEKTSEKKK